MSLEICYGSSQSKKTELIYENVIREAEIHPELQYIVLVPEQMSVTVQKKLIDLSPVHGLFNIDVLTFNRLAYRVFEDLDEQEGTVLSEDGKLMLLRLLLMKEGRTGKYPVFEKGLHKKGFLDELKSLISELVQYNISPEALLGSAEKVAAYPRLKEKLKETSEIYGGFMELLHRDYRMAEERMGLLARRIGDWGKLSSSVFILDGFTGFTPPQYEVVEVLLEKSQKVVLSAVFGSGRDKDEEKEEDSLFYMTTHMAAVLKEAAIRRSLPVYEADITEMKDCDEALLFLENQLYRVPAETYRETTEAVRILRAQNRIEEAEFVLSEVMKCIREGYEYRDLAVVCGDPEGYREEIEDVFNEAGIPFYMDTKRPLSANPYLSLVTAFTEAVKRDFSYESTAALLKNPLILKALDKKLPEDRLSVFERASELENFILASGARGISRLSKDFKGASGLVSQIRLPVINETRKVFVSLIEPYFTDFHKTDLTADRRIGILREFLQSLQAEESMSELAEIYDPAGLTGLKREYEQTDEALEKLFTEIEKILGDKIITEDEFRDILDTGIGRLKLGDVPTLDRLVIGDLKRTRLSGIKKLFVIGANEGLLPQKEAEGGLLTDTEREILKESEILLSPDQKEESFNARLYIYLLLTTPNESLTVTWAASDTEGKALTPSPLIDMLYELFPEVEKKHEIVDRHLLTTPERAARTLSEEVRSYFDDEKDVPEELKGLYQELFESGHHKEELRALETGFFYGYREEKLEKAAASALFGETLNGSVSSLERYASCAFRHFLGTGLGLKERQEYEIGNRDMGNLFHESINLFFRKLKESGLDWRTLGQKEQAELVRECVTEITDAYGFDIMKDSARNEALGLRVGRLTDRTLWALKDQWNRGSFETTETEVPFFASAGLDKLKLALDNGQKLELQGRIDRLDVREDQDKVSLRVIDYKSGNVKLDMTKVWYGLQLQLLVYMEAAKALKVKKYPDKEVVPAGIYYYHIDDPVVDEDKKKSPEELQLEKLRLKGLTDGDPDSLRMQDSALTGGSVTSGVIGGVSLNKDGSPSARSGTVSKEEMEKLGDYALTKAAELASGILSGNIAVNPYKFGKETGCTYCEFRSVCGFDERTGFSYRNLKKRELRDVTGIEDRVEGNE